MDRLLDWVRFYAERFLPAGQDAPGGEVEREVSERLVRHYVTLDVLDRPEKEGRENRYTIRHVLQMLVALKARILTGISVRALRGRLTSLTNEQLLALLVHGMEVSFVPSLTPSAGIPAHANSEALRRIAEIRAASEPVSFRKHPFLSWSEPPSSAPQVWWRRYPVLDTVELQIRSDFRFPVSGAEESSLLNSLQACLRDHRSKLRQ